MLLVKRCWYIDGQKMKAQKQKADADRAGKEVSEYAKAFLDENLNYAVEWTGTCKVTELDLFFNLLVYSTKATYESCYKLFDTYTKSAADDFMTRLEWLDMCKRVPFKLTEPMQDS